METIRTVRVTNGRENRVVEILRAADGRILYHEPADVNFDHCIEMADASDTSVQDVLHDGGQWEIV